MNYGRQGKSREQKSETDNAGKGGCHRKYSGGNERRGFSVLQHWLQERNVVKTNVIETEIRESKREERESDKEKT